MPRTRSLLLLIVAVAVTLCVTACGGSKTHTTTQSSTSGTSSSTATGSSTTVSGSSAGAYPTAFVTAFVKGCITSGGNQSYCDCVLDDIEKNVGYDTVAASKGEIQDGKKPSWYAKAIDDCLSKA